MTGRRGTAVTPRRWVAVLVAGLLVLSGCVSIPTSGPVVSVEGEQPACDTCVNLEVKPPAPGDLPEDIVANFLRANDSYQPGYTTARQFLTREAAAQWSPDQGVTVYTGAGNPVREGKTVTLTGEQVGFLNKDRTYTNQRLPLSVPFEVEQEQGQWRISRLPPGLTVKQYSFSTFYKPFDLYFLRDDNLVPQTIYLPNLRNPDSFASALVNALIDGPSDWLGPAVSTAVPQGTTLSVDSVTIVEGVAQVPLSVNVQTLTNRERNLLAAQIVYTLQQVTGVKKVLLLAGNQPLQVPESGPDLAVPVGAVPSDLAPVPQVSTEDLYVVQDKGLGRVSLDGDSVDVVPVTGSDQQSIDSLAVAAGGDQLAMVTDDRTVLRRGPTEGGGSEPALTGVRELLRPQFGRDGELWSVAEQGGRQRIDLFTNRGRQEVRAGSVFEAGRITAFAVSPDGARMALLVRSGGTTSLGLARIVRGTGTTRVEAWRPLDLTDPATLSSAAGRIDQIHDVVWTDATNLLILSSANAKGPFVPTRLTDDASEIDPEGETAPADPVELAVLLRTKTAVVAARDGKVYRDDGASWRPLLDGVRTMASPR